MNGTKGYATTRFPAFQRKIDRREVPADVGAIDPVIHPGRHPDDEAYAGEQAQITYNGVYPGFKKPEQYIVQEIPISGCGS
ncbi:hypothetical protein [Parapedobacter tibetensis]|uniref:hypothetical protein n=1 Tax=Parapedobacter tibetensis TaxID=2972951 RepID=UPI00214DA422|nr:hypothetical protein [Parapedobacter tibetensis]